MKQALIAGLLTSIWSSAYAQPVVTYFFDFEEENESQQVAEYIPEEYERIAVPINRIEMRRVASELLDMDAPVYILTGQSPTKYDMKIETKARNVFRVSNHIDYPIRRNAPTTIGIPGGIISQIWRGIKDRNIHYLIQEEDQKGGKECNTLYYEMLLQQQQRCQEAATHCDTPIVFAHLALPENRSEDVSRLDIADTLVSITEKLLELKQYSGSQ